MKKYLMTGVAALAMCAAFTSCSHDTTPMSQEEINALNVKTITDNYNQKFIATFGQVGSNVNWGFSSSSSRTRGGGDANIIKPDMTDFPGYSVERTHASNYRSPQGYADVIAPVTKKEAAWVQDWFDKNPGLSEQGQPFENFFIQHVSNNGYTKNGYFWSKEGGNDTKENRTYNNVYMDQLRVGNAASLESTTHVLDYNATSGLFNEWNVVYVQNGSALQFGYHESYGSSWQYLFKCVELTVPAECFEDNKPHTGWYVGLSYYSNKVEVENLKGHVLGEATLQYANDWIIKVVPGETKRNYRVIAEDLTFGTDAGADFDFNDVVFDVIGYDATTNKTTLRLQACGGTLPLTVAGQEVHGIFGENTKTMINTKNGTKTLDPVDFYIDGDYTTPEKINQIPIMVTKELNGQPTTIELKATTGVPASKVLVQDDYNWCNERQGILTPYPLFSDYVQGATPNFDWYRNN